LPNPELTYCPALLLCVESSSRRTIYVQHIMVFIYLLYRHLHIYAATDCHPRCCRALFLPAGRHSSCLCLI